MKTPLHNRFWIPINGENALFCAVLRTGKSTGAPNFALGDVGLQGVRPLPLAEEGPNVNATNARNRSPWGKIHKLKGETHHLA